ncbi:MAG: hypothetical protein ACE5DO_15780 [Desulfobacterales bacterium]
MELTRTELNHIIWRRTGLSQTEAAQKLGMHRVHFNRLINGRYPSKHFDARLYGLYRSQIQKSKRKAA